MATDYDEPRKDSEQPPDESIQQLKADRHEKNAGKIEVDEADAADNFELPGADLSHVELSVEVQPIRDNEFTCSSCFLVQHHSRRAGGTDKAPVCADCD
jgi:hypothetical protein